MVLKLYKRVGGDTIPDFMVDDFYKSGKMCTGSRLQYEADKRMEETEKSIFEGRQKRFQENLNRIRYGSKPIIKENKTIIPSYLLKINLRDDD